MHLLWSVSRQGMDMLVRLVFFLFYKLGGSFKNVYAERNPIIYQNWVKQHVRFIDFSLFGQKYNGFEIALNDFNGGYLASCTIALCNVLLLLDGLKTIWSEEEDWRLMEGQSKGDPYLPADSLASDCKLTGYWFFSLFNDNREQERYRHFSDNPVSPLNQLNDCIPQYWLQCICP